MLAPRLAARRFARVQFAVTLALAPLTCAVFGGVSLVGLAVNCLAIPVVSFVFVPLVLAGALAALVAPAACGALFSLAAALHEWLWPALVWAADLQLAQWRAVPPAWWFALAVAGGRVAAVALAVAAAPDGHRPAGCRRCSRRRACRQPARRGSPCSMPGAAPCVLIATHTRVLLFDTGDVWNTRGTRMAHSVFPALDALGRSVDVLVLPTLNEDRARGAALLATSEAWTHVVVGGGWPGASLPASRCVDRALRMGRCGLRAAGGRPAAAASVRCACRRAGMCCSRAATWMSPPSANCWHDCRRRRWRATSRSWDGRRVRRVRAGSG